ncbi:TRPV6 protein, partial [Amia calva]|nr:TRPV6 protein [Amia calva]
LSLSLTSLFSLSGALGETALHVAVLFDNLEASVALMEGVPDLINEPMTSDLFEGVTALHVAVLNQNVNLVRELIARGADASSPMATGWYFRKKRGGQFYFGEHVLSFAAAVGNAEILSMVIEAGADIRAQDSLGNTVLHILILQPSNTVSCQIFNLLMQLADRQEDGGRMGGQGEGKGETGQGGVSLDFLPNQRGLTPLKLAAKKGNVTMFKHMVDRRRREQWSLGPVTSTLYDLTEIDSWSDRRSVLGLIVSSSNRKARQVLEVTPVRQLASLKWRLYGQLYFQCLLLLYVLYLSCFTLCCFYRPLQPVPSNYTLQYSDSNTIYIQKPLQDCYVSYQDLLRLVGEIISVIGALVMLVLEIPSLWHFGPRRHFGQTVLGGPFHVLLIAINKTIYLYFSTRTRIILVLRLTSTNGEIDVMALALTLGWCNVMYFARGFKLLGPFVVTIQKIMCGDLHKFTWLLFVVIVGFSSGLWVVFMTQDPTMYPSFSSFGLTLFYEFQVAVAMVNLIVIPNEPTPVVVFVLYVVFGMLVFILLFNMVIAMMNDTHLRVAEEREEVWRAQVVAATLMLERRLPRWLWPRMGINGRVYGLGDNWYLRVDERNDQDAQNEEEDEVTEKPDPTPSGAYGFGPGVGHTPSGVPLFQPICRGRGQEPDITSKSLMGWQLIRRSTLGSKVTDEKGLEGETSV